MQMQELNGFPDGLRQVRSRRGLGRMLGGLAALSAMAAALTGEEVVSKRKKKRRRSGTQGPVGPAGPAGPIGPQGTPVTFVTVTGERSVVLPAVVNSTVEAIAECGLNSVPVNCGWLYIGSAAELDRTITQAGPGFFRGVGRCVVTLRRTAAVSAAGGQGVATALCTR